MKRIGLIGDVHAEDELLASALDYLKREKVDVIACVGDITDGLGDVDRCVALLEKHRVLTVRGNHDRWTLADEMRELPNATMRADLTAATRSYLRSLPSTRRLDTHVGPVLLCHGLGEDDMVFVDDSLELEDPRWRRRERGRLLRLVPEGVSLVFAGHTHRPKVRRLSRVTLVDAGTLRRSDIPGFVIVDLEMRRVQFYDLGEDGTVTPLDGIADRI